jgi:hypothetical protein
MQDIMQEIAAYRREFEALLAEWNALPLKARMESWSQYTEMLDHGDAGYHRFAPLLVNAWCEGWDVTQPFVFDREGAAPA